MSGVMKAGERGPQWTTHYDDGASTGSHGRRRGGGAKGVVGEGSRH